MVLVASCNFARSESEVLDSDTVSLEPDMEGLLWVWGFVGGHVDELREQWRILG